VIDMGLLNKLIGKGKTPSHEMSLRDVASLYDWSADQCSRARVVGRPEAYQRVRTKLAADRPENQVRVDWLVRREELDDWHTRVLQLAPSFPEALRPCVQVPIGGSRIDLCEVLSLFGWGQKQLDVAETLHFPNILNRHAPIEQRSLYRHEVHQWTEAMAAIGAALPAPAAGVSHDAA
jgi:hypothetical protein